jgi:L-serine dehydratase
MPNTFLTPDIIAREALMVLETDHPIPEEVLAAIDPVPAIESALLVRPL